MFSISKVFAEAGFVGAGLFETTLSVVKAEMPVGNVLVANKAIKQIPLLRCLERSM